MIGPANTTRLRIVRMRRDYNRWVANQTLEDYALRFTPEKARRWSAFSVAGTAIGATSFLGVQVASAFRNGDFTPPGAVVAGASSPKKRIAPASGISNPVMQRIMVDLPAPLRPTKPWISPAATVRLTSLSACVAP